MIYLILIAMILTLSVFNYKQKRMIRGLKNYSGMLLERVNEVNGVEVI